MVAIEDVLHLSTVGSCSEVRQELLYIRQLTRSGAALQLLRLFGFIFRSFRRSAFSDSLSAPSAAPPLPRSRIGCNPLLSRAPFHPPFGFIFRSFRRSASSAFKSRL